jgi:predicted lipid-binding transport protein (Tim44 family)
VSDQEEILAAWHNLIARSSRHGITYTPPPPLPPRTRSQRILGALPVVLGVGALAGLSLAGLVVAPQAFLTGFLIVVIIGSLGVPR